MTKHVNQGHDTADVLAFMPLANIHAFRKFAAATCFLTIHLQIAKNVLAWVGNNVSHRVIMKTEFRLLYTVMLNSNK